MKLQELRETMTHTESTSKEFKAKGQVKDLFRTEEGLNIFTITDGSADLKASIFTPGNKAYPEIEKDSYVELIVTKKIYNGMLQGNLVRAKLLEGSEKKAFEEELHSLLNKKYIPKDQQLLITTPSFEHLKPSLVKAATEIRKAIIDQRPILISHHGDCDGFSAGFLLERAIKSLIQKYHSPRFMNNYFNRIPSKTPFYDLIDATKDIGSFLSSQERNNTEAPLIIITDNGSTIQDLLSIRKAKLFGAEFVVVDHHHPGDLDEQGQSIICPEVLAHVNPHLHGITTNISASLLNYQLAYYINRHEQPSPFIAAVGAITDKCDGEEVPFMIEKSGYDKEYLARVGILVDYEIFLTKMNTPVTVIHSLLSDNAPQRDALLELYEPELKQAEAEVKTVINHYAEKKTYGPYSVLFMDGESLTQRGDYFSIGKFAGIAHATLGSDVEPTITCVYSDSMLVFRVTPDDTHSFSVLDVLAHLNEKFPHARVSGGGHPVAGSIKFIPAAKEEILGELHALLEKMQ